MPDFSRWNPLRLLRIKKKKPHTAWPNPKLCCGQKWDEITVGGRVVYTVWRAKGRARTIWDEQLRDKINSHLVEKLPTTVGLAVEMFMIGPAEEKASPTVVFLSLDGNETLRVEARNAIARSGILDGRDYQGIGLGDSNLAPSLAAGVESDHEGDDEEEVGDGVQVFALASDAVCGRPIVFNANGSSDIRRMTGGPVFYTKRDAYQLVPAHPFRNIPSTEADDSGETEGRGFTPRWDLDIMDFEDSVAAERGSDEEGGVHRDEADDRSTSEDETISKPTHGIGEHDHDGGIGAHMPAETLHAASITPWTRNDDGDKQKQVSGPRGVDCRDFSVPDRARVCIGTVSILSEEFAETELDYGLVKLLERPDNANRIRLGHKGSGIWQSLTAAEMPQRDMAVMTVTGSSGFLKGHLCSTASSLHLEGWSGFQQLYPVMLQGVLSKGDCGAGIVDIINGKLYGHIIAIVPGTGRGYIIPAKSVLDDIQQRLGEEVHLYPPEKSSASSARTGAMNNTLWWINSDGQKGPRRTVEFASPSYFRALSRVPVSHQPPDENTRRIRQQHLDTRAPSSPSPVTSADVSDDGQLLAIKDGQAWHIGELLSRFRSSQVAMRVRPIRSLG
jgi:hypothetical protein